MRFVGFPLKKGFLVALAVLGNITPFVSAHPPLPAHSNSGGTNFNKFITRESTGRQNIVTWDEHSLFIKGKRVMIWSGEFHPWRLPVPGLWLDVFEKIKALGFNAVSFYVHWGLVEYKRGEFNFDGFRSLELFFEAAKKAGIYLIARPGPYINAETTGGGFPGWGVQVPGPWRTFNKTYVDAYTPYIKEVGSRIAKAQITNGGPVILLQVENELSVGVPGVKWPQSEYVQDLIDKFRTAGVVVPTVNNDAWPTGNHVPGSGVGAVDVYAHDGYPNGFDCERMYDWPVDGLPKTWYEDHMRLSPKTPYAILEFQGGAFDDWGGEGYDSCEILTNNEMVRVFFKNNLSFGVKIFNVYMTFGGTNWGGVAGAPVYTSYDYGSPIKETREITREKYSEMKLEVGMVMSSPAYLTSVPTNDPKSGAWTDNPALWITRLADTQGKTNFWVLRQSNYVSTARVEYSLQIPTSAGNMSIPQLGKRKLGLNGRDSRIHITDYKLGDFDILYSSSELFTWHSFGSRTVAIFYGSPGEVHETAFTVSPRTKFSIIEDNHHQIKETSHKENRLILNYETTHRTISSIDNLLLYVMDKNSAYKWWDVKLIEDGNPFNRKSSVFVYGPYLVRSAEITGSILNLRGDLNATTEIEVIAPPQVKTITWNGEKVQVRKQSDTETWKTTLEFKSPKITLPVLGQLKWKYSDSFPERLEDYDDVKWIFANKMKLSHDLNPHPVTTPNVLYASEYGFHNGAQLWRGHFVATGMEKSFNVTMRGNVGFSFAAYLDDVFIGKHAGIGQLMFEAGEPAAWAIKSFNFPDTLKNGSFHILTIVQDHMGLSAAWTAGSNEFQTPVGILDYNFNQLSEKVHTNIDWKLTGNLGGEDYKDKARGPLNEGGFYAERHGWHLPGLDTSKWPSRSPYDDGIGNAGLGFFTTTFDLDLPRGYDIPLAFDFKNTTVPTDFRVFLYVNGYQFGKYSNNLGPQISFPVPEGILNHQARNTVGLLLWSMQPGVVKLGGLELVAKGVYQSGYGRVVASPQPKWEVREDAY